MPGGLTKGQTAAFFSRLSPALPPLTRQYAAGKAPHALLILGQGGVGKATLASLLAGALLCEGENRPCGSCPACQKADKGSHANLLVVKAALKQRAVKVEQARQLLSSLAAYPFSPGPRVVLLERVDTFTPQAQNALLKAVEEPDPDTFFLLTSQNEDAVLPTIRSRCQGLRLPPWEDALLREVLRAHSLAADEIDTLVPLSLGSPGKALDIRGDQAFWAVKRLADETFLAIDGLSGLPAASIRLKDAKDRAALLLDYLENTALTLPGRDRGKNRQKARALLSGVANARKMQASNLSWQAISDQLLLHIIKETT